MKNLALDKRAITHYVCLAVILLMGALLRFWQLDSKPLWLDEVLTAIFSMGRSYADVPVQTLFPVAALEQLFTLQPGISCPQIAQTVATESVHPPLFFCLVYGWVNWLAPGVDHWVWALRSLPALVGVGAIAAIYLLNRVAFSATAGLAAAALMAVSPFAVYLSQEARHYTLPMLLITLALVGLVQMQQDLYARSRLRPAVWLGWVAINSIGLYTHYFCILALAAQVVALGGWMLWQRYRIQKRYFAAFGLAIAAIVLTYIPWLPNLLNHFSRPETDWLETDNPDLLSRIVPLYQTVVGWVLMVIALPVERQPRAIAILSVLGMLVFSLWLVWQVKKGLVQLWQKLAVRPPLLLLAGFTLCVIAEFFSVVYVLNKDITVVPRYNFVYYPGVCALLAVCLAGKGNWEDRRDGGVDGGVVRGQSSVQRFPTLSIFPILPVLLAGILSSAIVVNGFAFQKSYNPDRVVKKMTAEPSTPMVMVTGYRSLQEIALGLSFALELRNVYPDAEKNLRFGFLDRRESYANIWRSLARLPNGLSLPLNVWAVVPEIRRRDFPLRIRLANPSKRNTRVICAIDPKKYHRLGFPYQMYRCPKK